MGCASLIWRIVSGGRAVVKRRLRFFYNSRWRLAHGSVTAHLSSSVIEWSMPKCVLSLSQHYSSPFTTTTGMTNNKQIKSFFVEAFVTNILLLLPGTRRETSRLFLTLRYLDRRDAGIKALPSAICSSWSGLTCIKLNSIIQISSQGASGCCGGGSLFIRKSESEPSTI